jgi:hypothetical protein
MAKKDKKNTDVQLKARISKELWEQVNKFRFDHQMETRTDAVVELLTRGLAGGGGTTDGGSHGKNP